MKIRQLLFGAVALLFAASGAARAQDDGGNSFGGGGNIWLCGDGNGNSGHSVQGGPSGAKVGLHLDCRICLTQGGCHPDCWVSSRPDSPTATKIYASILAAARRSDVKAITTLALSLPGFVEYNAARGSVQILNCSGSGVIANIPISKASERRYVASLPRTGDYSTASLAEAPR